MIHAGETLETQNGIRIFLAFLAMQLEDIASLNQVRTYSQPLSTSYLTQSVDAINMNHYTLDQWCSTLPPPISSANTPSSDSTMPWLPPPPSY